MAGVSHGTSSKEPSYSGGARSGANVAGVIEQEVSKAFQAYRKEWKQLHKEEAQACLQETRAKLREHTAKLEEELRKKKYKPITKYAIGSKRAPDSLELRNHESGTVRFKIPAREPLRPAQKGKAPVFFEREFELRVPVSIIPKDDGIPPYVAWQHLLKNELAKDHGKKMFYTDNTGETVPAGEENDDEVMPWHTSDGAAVDYSLAKVVAEFGDGDEVVEAVATKLNISFEAVRSHIQYTIHKPLTAADRQHIEVDEVLEMLSNMLCRRCRIYNCRLHSGPVVKPHRKPAPPPGPDDSPPCGQSCHKIRRRTRKEPDADMGSSKRSKGAAGEATDRSTPAANSSPAAGAPPGISGAGGAGGGSEVSSPTEVAFQGWTPYEISLFRKGQQVFGNNSCRIALLMGCRTCVEVKTQLGLAPTCTAGETGAAQPRKGSVAAAGRRRKPQSKPARKGPQSSVVHKRLNHDTGTWPEYLPCRCVGPCGGPACSCIQNKNFCEKFCACGPTCTNRWKGCVCKGQCKTNQCPCLAAQRECDPDLCKGCAATCEGNADPDTECHNMRLRLRQHARVVMGVSTIPGAGWGAFLQGEKVEKGAFIGEYTGSQITQDEADRRGEVYDRIDNSYLFELNEQWVLDARHMGNKLRFANHNATPNCRARILLVDGDHRIGIFACTTIQPGDELFYDYKYMPECAPKWAAAS